VLAPWQKSGRRLDEAILAPGDGERSPGNTAVADVE